MNAVEFLASIIQPKHRILDVGCGTGGLLNLMPLLWKGGYFGIDQNAEQIKIAHSEHPGFLFSVGHPVNLKDFSEGSFDWAVISSRKLYPFTGYLFRVAKRVCLLEMQAEAFEKVDDEKRPKVFVTSRLEKEPTPLHKAFKSHRMEREMTDVERNQRQDRERRRRSRVLGKPFGRPPHK